uniref:VOC domain-containing protein n=1 Tax=Chromera velia CCMP2878 TaxID=1169474 RepID=A0A0G4GML8_9ALVE|eukprot:Cvel_4920.t1-p1 / transcript=Cvel_4920.t1 / gene=Cvel_4920 / organism=Chromera_velia_CCMP2878 / gene_product=hypothetical protein / transcript_product=hypothetical protein / location=Cvel_scaffold222:11809-12789(+) / protein_length=327 / sequence_SO=supercontig / SO=protein_coding / is_pseudo=false
MASTMRVVKAFRACHLSVSNAARSREFFVKQLGMVETAPVGNLTGAGVGNKGGTMVSLGFPQKQEGEMDLWLTEVKDATASAAGDPGNLYWKIGIIVTDLDCAVAKLRERGVRISDPSQFRDIGYLAHLTDPDGLTIELLQRTFEHKTKLPEEPELVNQVLGTRATLSHITLRTGMDLGGSSKFFSDTLGLKLLSVQPVEPYAFSLFFFAPSGLAHKEKMVREDDLFAVENREWLWQRPVTVLELQQRTRGDFCPSFSPGALGLREIVLDVETVPADGKPEGESEGSDADEKRSKEVLPLKLDQEGMSGMGGEVKAPEGTPLRFLPV